MRIIVLLLITFILSSCGKEKLTPQWNPKTINELKNFNPFFFSIDIDENVIDGYAKNSEKLPIFGKIFKSIAITIANISISKEKGHEIILNDFEYELPPLDDSGIKFINWINLNSVTLKIKNESKETLKFIDKIEICAKLDDNSEDLKYVENSFVVLLSYDSKFQTLNNNEKELRMEIPTINWKKFILKNKKITLRPKIIINSVPKKDIILGGSIVFSVMPQLGF